MHEPAQTAAPATPPASKAVEATPFRIDMERGVVVGMERAQVVVVARTKLDPNDLPQRLEFGLLTPRPYRLLVHHSGAYPSDGRGPGPSVEATRAGRPRESRLVRILTPSHRADQRCGYWAG